ncbi:hypothetical protein A33M_1200 [Rhodovulum sp. PH10]|nr:hypothetical protein A33M_1200 [Rhodovulum sp. PH10]
MIGSTLRSPRPKVALRALPLHWHDTARTEGGRSCLVRVPHSLSPSRSGSSPCRAPLLRNG